MRVCLLTDGAGKYALIRQTYATRNYVCVAGFIKEHETAEQTALREIREETGLEVLNMQYISSYYYPKHDNLMLGYLCTVKHGDRKSTRLNSSHSGQSRMPSSA